MADQIFFIALDPLTRDSYGFALRPQHTQRYRQYANIYKEEEEERSDKWNNFLELLESTRPSSSSLSDHKDEWPVEEATENRAETNSESHEETDDTSERILVTDGSTASEPENEVRISRETECRNVKTWAQIRSFLKPLERIMSLRAKKRKKVENRSIVVEENHLQSITEKEVSTDDDDQDYSVTNTSFSVKEVCDGPSEHESTTKEEEMLISDSDGPNEGNERDDSVNDRETNDCVDDKFPIEPFFSWKEELECLVRGGVPKDLRGEVWQVFAGVKARRVERYYQDLLARENVKDSSNAETKWKRQIEKDIPRTFPGHPALNENGRNSLRRVLLAYARHNPSVGYCQAMNFFAGLLLLLMPEENAFWTLVGIMDDYFEGYYTEEMIESQVDQLVLEELMRERFPKLVNHLDYLGVQVAWISGPWFLSIFVNMLPWESVLRVWDVLLYEGNRNMLFRTALALTDLYGPALVTTKDAGDATTLLQSLAGSTFDSSQLVLTACMGFLGVTEATLEELREKHRPAVLEVVEERAKRGRVWKDSKGLAVKLYSFKHDPVSLVEEKKSTEVVEVLSKDDRSVLKPRHSSKLEDLLDHLAVNPELDSLPDLQEQAIWLKVELCRLLEEKRSAILRAEELETALMEMVKQDNRRQLSAKVEELEQEVAYLHQALSDKKEQEAAMLKVLMRVEHEQQVTEDARLNAEQEVATQKYAVYLLQEKYDKAMSSIAEMEKRVVMAESMLEATLQYQSGQTRAHSSPGGLRSQDSARKTGLLPFGLGWRDRNKAKAAHEEEECGEVDSSNSTQQRM